ncbi:MAG: hypothetical protein E7354_04100 [Clostridiales bacterium]|nr:hypothetical protein [Clostridiales bacterium]
MNWLYSFIAAFVLIFAVPFANNYDEVKLIVNDIKNAIIKEISYEDLLAQLSDSFSFGSMEQNTQSNIPEVVFDEDYEGEFSEEIKKYVPVNSESSEQDAQVLAKMRERYLKTVTPEKMLELSAEVYTGEIFKLVSSAYNVKKGKVEGWSLVSSFPKDKPASDNGTSIRLWVNNVDNETYCISIAGTDSFDEVITQYIPMETSPTYSSQQKEIGQYVKNLASHIRQSPIYSKCGQVKKLYTTGHSMGAFFSMWLGTDLYDSNQYSFTKCSDVGPYLKPENVKAYTYAAPGLLTAIPEGIPADIKDILNVGDQIPEWSRYKLLQDKNHHYDTMLFQYTNSRDLVTDLNSITEYNLLPKSLTKDWIKFNFVHIGNEYHFTSKQLTVSESLEALQRFDIFKDPATSVLNFGAVVLSLEYHMPYQYLSGFTNNKYRLV